MKFELDLVEPLENASSEELAKIILARLGLVPRKNDALAKFHTLLIELYERKKVSNRDKKPEMAVMTVEEMGVHAGIKRQTMYDHLNRWLALNLLKKTSFVSDGKIITGYEINGPTLEAAFLKTQYVIQNHMSQTLEIIKTFQNELKKEKLRNMAAEKPSSEELAERKQENPPV